jgi:hypothetical protein
VHYKNKTEKSIQVAFDNAPKDDKKEFMIWITENIDKKIQGFVRYKYLGKSFYALKRNGSCLKLKDMGVDANEYGDIFKE